MLFVNLCRSTKLTLSLRNQSRVERGLNDRKKKTVVCLFRTKRPIALKNICDLVSMNVNYIKVKLFMRTVLPLKLQLSNEICCLKNFFQ